MNAGFTQSLNTKQLVCELDSARGNHRCCVTKSHLSTDLATHNCPATKPVLDRDCAVKKASNQKILFL